MKTTIALGFGLALVAGLAQAETLANGLGFRTPAGWTVKSNADAAALLPPDLVMEADGSGPSEIYLLGMQEGVVDVRDPNVVAGAMKNYFPAESKLRLADLPRSFAAAGGSGYLYRYDAVSDGTPVRVQVYVVGMTNGGAAALIAIARPALIARRESVLSTVAASLSVVKPAAPARTASAPAPAAHANGGPLAAQWDQRLRGRKLYQFSSYSSGSSGGYNSQKTLLLGVNGVYEFHRSGSVSMYVDGANGGSSSQSGDQGKWRIYEQSGKVMLELTSNQGAAETIVLTAEGTKTMLNGNRWLVGD